MLVIGRDVGRLRNVYRRLEMFLFKSFAVLDWKKSLKGWWIGTKTKKVEELDNIYQRTKPDRSYFSSGTSF